LKTSGALGNNITTIDIEDTILKANTVIEPGSAPRMVAVGTNEETNEDIKINAPIFYNTANRAVTAMDYKAICERRTEVQRCIVYGGEDKIEKEIGNVYLSFLSSITSNNSDKFNHDVDNNVFRLINNDIYDNATGIVIEPNASTFYNNQFYLSDTNVNDILKYLERYKIMTMKLIHVNPVFIDCDIMIKVMRYINDSKSTQMSLFNVINSYFKSDMNEFGVEYFNSNVIRMVDGQFGNISGVDINVEYSINLSTGNMISVGDNFMFQFYLELPFEAMYNESTPEKLLIVENMPNIDTVDFIKNYDVTLDHSLIVDYTRVKHTIDLNAPYQVNDISEISELDVLPIVYAGKDVGQYIIRNGVLDSDNYIRVDIWINNGGNGTDVFANSSLLKSYFNQPQKIRLANKTDNVRFFRNSIPRLNSVQFI
jgi:hypothetical protein